MRQASASAGGRLAIGLSVMLLFWVALSGVGVNVANGWTVAVCGVAGFLALEMRPRPALVLLVVGATPALLGGVGLLYLPSLVLVAFSALAPRQPAAAPN